MFIGLFVIFAVFALSDLYINKNLFIYLSLIILILVAGLRSINTGLDTYNYYFDYNSVMLGFPPINSSEKGYVLLEKIFTSLNSPICLFFLFIAAVTLSLIAVGFSKLSIDKYATGLLILYYYSRFFINRDLNQIRASLASAIILCSLIYIYKQKPIAFTICILIATLIHSATMVGLIIYPVVYLFRKISKKKIIITYVFCLIFSAILSFPISPILQTFNSNRLNVYINNQLYVSGNGLKNPIIILQILISLVGVLYLLTSNKVNDKYLVVLSTYMISTILLILLSQYNTLAGRTSTFFATVEPILIWDILRLQFGKKTSAIIMILFSIVIFILINYSTGVIPQLNYRFI